MAINDFIGKLIQGYESQSQELLKEIDDDLSVQRDNLFNEDLINLNNKLDGLGYKAHWDGVSYKQGVKGTGILVPELTYTKKGSNKTYSETEMYLDAGSKSTDARMEVGIYENFAIGHYRGTEKLKQMERKAIATGGLTEQEIRTQLDTIYSGTSGGLLNAPKRKEKMIKSTAATLLSKQKRYNELQTQLIKAKQVSGDKTPFSSGRKEVTNPTVAKMEDIKAKTPSSYGQIVGGVTSLPSYNNTFKGTLNLEQMPKMPKGETIKELQKVAVSRSKLKMSKHNMIPANQTAVFYDTETIGDLGSDNFGVTQYTFRYQDSQGKEVEWSPFVKQSGGSTDLIEKTIRKLENNQSLTPTEERTAWWLRDFELKTLKTTKSGKSTYEISAAHKDTKGINLYDSKTIEEIKIGYQALTDEDNIYSNRISSSNEALIKGLRNIGVIGANSSTIKTNKVLVGQNNFAYDDRILKDKGINVGNKTFDTLRYMRDNYDIGSYNKKTGQYLLGYQNEELASFFGVDVKSMATDYLKKHSREVTDKAIAELQHTSDWDTLLTQGVYNAIKADNTGTTTKAISVGMKAIALKSGNRIYENEYNVDLNNKGQVVNDNNAYNTHRLIRKGGTYTYKGMQKLGNGMYRAIYHDEERNIDSYMVGTEKELAARNAEMFGIDSWMSQKDFDSKYSTKDKAINDMFGSYYELKQQLGIHNKTVKSPNAKHKGRYDLAQDFIKNNQEVLETIVNGAKGLDKVQQDLFVKAMGQQLGLVSFKGMNAGELHDYITSNASNKFNSMIHAYEQFLDNYGFAFETTKEGKAMISNIRTALTNLQSSGSEETLAKQSNLFYGISRMISEGLIKTLPEGTLIRDYNTSGWKGQDINYVNSTIETTRKMISSMFVGKDEKISSVLYKNAEENSKLRKNLDGRNTAFRLRKLGVEDKHVVGGTVKKEKDPSKKMSFAEGTLGEKLNQLQKLTQSKNIGFTVVKNADESALTLAF